MNNEEKDELEQDEKISEETDELEQESINDDGFDENQEVFTYTVDNNNIKNDYKTTENNPIIYIIIGMIILFSIIITLVVVVNKKNKKMEGYTSIESKLEEAAKKYYKKYPEQLPLDEDSNVEITAEELIENNLLKPFEEMTNENVECTGIVSVYKVEDEYSFYPYLNCGTAYKSTKLSDKIIEDNLVTTGDGLYTDNNEFVFRGEYPKNYVKFDDKMWQIIKINEDKSIKLISLEKKLDKVVWDDRYNQEKDGYVGINDFNVSRILEELKDGYEKNAYVSKKNKKLLTKQSWCVGKITESEIPIISINICDNTYDDLYVGLINIKEVLQPSIDKNCITTDSTSCTNYNYLYRIDTGWTLNASNDNSYIVFNSSDGIISTRNAASSDTIRPVININNNILYKSGNGTQESPYVIE